MVLRGCLIVFGGSQDGFGNCLFEGLLSGRCLYGQVYVYQGFLDRLDCLAEGLVNEW